MIVVLVLLILGAIFLLLKQQRKIQKLKTNTDKVYRKALEEKYKNLEENAPAETIYKVLSEFVDVVGVEVSFFLPRPFLPHYNLFASAQW